MKKQAIIEFPGGGVPENNAPSRVWANLGLNISGLWVFAREFRFLRDFITIFGGEEEDFSFGI